MIEYREYAPPPDLADAVRCIWFLAATPGATAPQRILPDGCVELVFNFLREFRAFAGVSPSTFFGREDNAMSSAFTGAADS